jgi:hypothetical protein
MLRRTFLATMLGAASILAMASSAEAGNLYISNMVRSGSGVTVYFYWANEPAPIQLVQAEDIYNSNTNEYSVNPAAYTGSGSLYLPDVLSGDRIYVYVYNSGIEIDSDSRFAP